MCIDMSTVYLHVFAHTTHTHTLTHLFHADQTVLERPAVRVATIIIATRPGTEQQPQNP